ncbi:MAG: hypothetical protein V4635_04850 [Bacteroidota bacterium]
MKAKTITLCAVIISAIGLFSFKALNEKESSNVATMSLVSGKAGEGFLVAYGDGSNEIIPFKWKLTLESYAEQQLKATQIANELHEKGYRFVGTGGASNFMIFEKK